jgi:hypothetical protein
MPLTAFLNAQKAELVAVAQQKRLCYLYPAFNASLDVKMASRVGARSLQYQQVFLQRLRQSQLLRALIV